jgi:hypothetical protein
MCGVWLPPLDPLVLTCQGVLHHERFRADAQTGLVLVRRNMADGNNDKVWELLEWCPVESVQTVMQGKLVSGETAYKDFDQEKYEVRVVVTISEKHPEKN